MLQAWFVNVGHGDSTIIKFPSGRIMMIDINNCLSLDERSREELAETMGIRDQYAAMKLYGLKTQAFKDYEALLEDPVELLKRVCPGEDIWRFVATHPHMDHLSGLYHLWQESGIKIENFWDTANTKAEDDFDESKYDKRDWDEYQRLRKCNGNPNVLRLNRGAKGNYWTDDGVFIASPTPDIVKVANENEDWNHLSQVQVIVYGQCSIMMMADATCAVQQELASLFGSSLKTTIYRAPHHGRDSCYCEELMALAKPDYTIVSVGKKPDNDATNKYKKHSKKVYSTRFQGTIYAELEYDGTVRMFNHAGDRIDIQAERARQERVLAQLLRGGR